MRIISVPVFKRSPNKLQAYTDVIKMATYTIQMCENDKVFPKKCRWNICSRIIDLCLECVVLTRKANKIHPTDIEQARLRVKLQYEVLLNFDALYCLMDIAYQTYNIPSEKIATWSKIIVETEKNYYAWRKSDIARFKKDFSD